MIVTTAAGRDLDDIYDYIAADSPIAAADFIRDLGQYIQSAAEGGHTGHPRGWISKDLRAIPYRKRCFYFRIEADDFVLLRVLHGAQDVDQIDFG